MTPWTIACQSPLSIGLPRQEYWSMLPFPSPRDLPKSGIEPGSPACAFQAHSLKTATREAQPYHCMHAKSLQSCLTLCDPVDCSPPGSSVNGILQQEFWNGVPFPSPEGLLYPRIEPTSLMSPALAAGFFTTSAIWEAQPYHYEALIRN